jgi:glucuronosyltransferase
MIDLSFADQRMQILFNDPSTKFDVVIVINFFGDAAGYYIAHRFNASLVLYFTGQMTLPWIDEAVGQPHNTAYLPTAFLPFTTEMTFIQRAINTFGNFFFHRIIRNFFILRKDYEILKKHFPTEEIPDLSELERKASLSISFGHPLILDGWRPVAPNHVYLGMMNCKEPKQLDPEDKIAKFLNNSKEGVIYVSFGSVVRASHMSDDRRKMFLNVFKGLKQKILWKWETEEMEDKPDNVLLSKWLPQQKVLAHPNVKLFITHGEQASFQETLCHKKPVVSLI